MPTSTSKSDPHDHVRDLVAQCFSADEHTLCVGGIQIDKIVQQFGTPCFVHDASIAEQRLNDLRNTLGDEFDIFYSVKANPNQRFLRHFLDLGCGLEIASDGELHQALAAGCPENLILFAGPGKTDRELEYAVANKIDEIHLESIGEANRLSPLATKLGRAVNVSVRVNPGNEFQGGAMRMGGKPTQFGIDEEQLESTLDEMLKLPGLHIQGIHLFPGTQILDSETLLTQYGHAITLATRMANQLGRRLATIDFGGGLGVPYFVHESDLDLTAVRQGLQSIKQRIRDEPLLADARLVVEPGRFLTADSGVYVTRVIDIKESRGKRFVIVDGGMHHHLAASGNLGQTIKRNYPIGVLNKLGIEASESSVEIVGPLCTPLDQLARGVSLPAVEIGDLIGVFRSGAYARTASPHGFLSHPSPAEIWVENGTSELIRRRGRPEDLLRDQIS